MRRNRGFPSSGMLASHAPGTVASHGRNIQSRNYEDTLYLNAIRSTTTSNTYDNEAVNWRLGRLRSTQVTTTRTGMAAQTRSSAFEYNATTGLLEVEKIQPGGSASQQLSTFYEYENGNVVSTRTCSGDVVDAQCRTLSAVGLRFRPASAETVRRYSRTEYAGGVFPLRTREPFYNGQSAGEGGASEVVTMDVVRDLLGNPTRTTDANSFVAVASYDAFGRKYFEGNSSGASSTVTRQWCPSSLCPTASGIGARYVVTVTSANGAASWTYFDALDREVLSLAKGFSGAAGATRYIAIRKTYDEQGRPKSVSEPYFSSAPGASAGVPSSGSVYWTTTQYDALGRSIRTDHPNGTSTDIVYHGRVVTRTLPVNKLLVRETKTEQSNYLGELESVQDHLGSFVEYERDALGNITTTRRLAGGISIESTAQYDVLGRREELHDPDTGSWFTTYNAAGEVVRHASASTCVASRYDARGRLWKRDDYANATCSGIAPSTATWLFDTAVRGWGKLDTVTTVDFDLVTARMERYDAIGRTNRVETTVGADTYVERLTFDALGRPMQSFFSGTQIPEQGELVEYDAHGYSYRMRDAMNGTSGRILHETTQRNARGQVTEERRADSASLVSSRSYEPATGRLLSIVTPDLQNLTYEYDPLGNLSERWDLSVGTYVREVMTYDALQRLTRTDYLNAVGGTLSSNAHTYDPMGNLTPVGVVSYGVKPSSCLPSDSTPGPGALAVLNATQFCYDSRGNRTRQFDGSVSKQTVTYTPYEQVREVRSTVSSARTVRYHYGAERQRLRRLDYTNDTAAGTPTTANTVGNAEILVRAGSTTREVRRNLGPVIRSRTIASSAVVLSSEERFVFTDAQGSPHRITNAQGTVPTAGRMRFAAFGRRASPIEGLPLSVTAIFSFPDTQTRMGYTGHEQADPVGLIHMNGRMYDPLVGRFLQADPLVQDPGNLQSLNRYSYVLNNPFAYTDPTGYWGRREQGYLRTAVAIGIAVWTGVWIGGAVSAGTITTAQAAGLAAAGGAASGAVATGAMRGALIGAFSGFVGYQIGTAFIGVEGSLGHVAAHATLGGITTHLNGGKFGHGFVSAGMSAGLAPYLDTGNTFTSALGHAIVGGTTSVISGGKFANGAITASFEYAFNKAAHNQRDKASVTVIEGAGIVGHATPDSATLAAYRYHDAAYKSLKPGRELLGAIVGLESQNGVQYYFTSTVEVDADQFDVDLAVNVRSGARGKTVWLFHSHPPAGSNPFLFSPADGTMALNMPFAVRMPNGDAQVLSNDDVRQQRSQERSISKRLTMPYVGRSLCPGGKPCLP